jgi:hypothetical protein
MYQPAARTSLVRDISPTGQPAVIRNRSPSGQQPSLARETSGSVRVSSLFVLIQGHGKVKRKTVHFRALHRNKAYFVGEHLHVFFKSDRAGDVFVMAKLPPTA